MKINHALQNVVSAINYYFKAQFARYAVMDDHGTLIFAWTYNGAFSWMSYCGKCAWIRDLSKRKTVVWRLQDDYLC
jgi:hypothetical protein